MIVYVRFVITQIDGDSHQPRGVFVAAHSLLRSGDLTAEEYRDLRREMIWFNKNLPSPDQSDIHGRVTFWFKLSAQKCIRRVWRLVNLLRLHGYLVEVQKCERLCNPVYRDEYQVAAYPHQRDGRRTVK